MFAKIKGYIRRLRTPKKETQYESKQTTFGEINASFIDAVTICNMDEDSSNIAPIIPIIKEEVPISINIESLYSITKQRNPQKTPENSNNARNLRDFNINLKEYMNKITLGYVADRLFLSERQAARIIKKAYNQSFSELLLSRRLTVASVMLTTTGEKVSGIAESTGFRTENYFFSCFRKRFGMTPICYRKLYG